MFSFSFVDNQPSWFTVVGVSFCRRLSAQVKTPGKILEFLVTERSRGGEGAFQWSSDAHSRPGRQNVWQLKKKRGILRKIFSLVGKVSKMFGAFEKPVTLVPQLFTKSLPLGIGGRRCGRECNLYGSCIDCDIRCAVVLQDVLGTPAGRAARSVVFPSRTPGQLMSLTSNLSFVSSLCLCS